MLQDPEEFAKEALEQYDPTDHKLYSAIAQIFETMVSDVPIDVKKDHWDLKARDLFIQGLRRKLELHVVDLMYFPESNYKRCPNCRNVETYIDNKEELACNRKKHRCSLKRKGEWGCPDRWKPIYKSEITPEQAKALDIVLGYDK